MDKVLLSLENVRRSYNQGDSELEVLHGINVTIKAGEMVAIIGPSGSGKSTLMNIIGCLDKPSSGAYKVKGQDTANMSADELATLRRDFFGFIFQRYHLLSHLSASENVQIPAVYAGINKVKRQQRANELLSNLGLKERVDYNPNQLSGGQQQRVSIARALMNGGQIILADEPTGALDTKSGQEVMRTLQELNELGHTIIIVTHDPRIAACAKRVIAIEDGYIKEDKFNDKPVSLRHSFNYDAKIEIKDSLALSLQAFIDRFKEAFIMAYRAMIANRLRTMLTMLGIIIGIMAVVSVVALAKGASQKVLATIASMGTNTITVYPGSGFGDVRRGRVRTLTPRDLVAIKGQPFVDSIAATVQTNALIRHQAIESNATIQGVSLEVFRVYGLSLQDGRFFSESEINNKAQVVVIDNNTANYFFPNTNPLGKNLIVNNMVVKIIGVLNKSESFIIRGDNPTIFMPYTAVMTRLINQNYLSSIVVRIKDDFSSSVADNAIYSILKSRHNRVDFFTYSSDAVMKSIEEATSTFTIMISAIALISLVVGGIGVMNIMLVSVTERTKEIGIRMAVGARQIDILAQFLIEAVLVCLTGGFLGVILSFIVGNIIMSLAKNISLIYSIESIIAAVVTSSLIGIVFGFMPAHSAAKLNPIEALARD